MKRQVDAATMKALLEMDGQTVDVFEMNEVTDVDGVPIAVDAVHGRETVVIDPALLGWKLEPETDEEMQ